MINPLTRVRDFLAPDAHRLELPLFPLNSVLFPDGRLRLKVFEARYLDMAAACLRLEQPFGICLIKQGSEVGPAALPEAVGCHARIVTADMDTPGVMLLEVRGEGRFVVESTRLEANQLLVGQVRDKDDEALLPVPAGCRAALDFLNTLAARAPEAGLDEIRDDATWVGFRLAELLPLKAGARQAMLEMNDAVKRLEILLEFMRRNGLA
ncbi:MAG: LON peptidase substrate-binding domain-containing protein [Pseudomonadota bacterium]|nr:LON peptidase substrate-binding domain-containing protein [Pseudomonadota bacterium]MDP1905698.1 LON peptidase substrate-binding domain-containing protein [Pseudomonadota bacterium]MDP2353570.1 LON peptidase substrate-binding domain-containing protein [Pseudomonadota bacterium]